VRVDRSRWVTWACVAGVAIMALAFFGVGSSTSWARIAVLRTVEPYAMAVHEQLLFNFAETGRFFQTIHTGYEDALTWSGHRAGTLPIVGLLYGLAPSPFFLSALLIGAVTLGVVPAAALGRRAFRHPLGMLAGAALYLGCPAVMGLALQDYQDLALALPFLMVTLWALRARAWWWVLLGALVGCLPREECIPVVVAAAVVSIDLRWERPWRRWLRNLGIAGGVALFYGIGMALAFPLHEASHSVPVAASLGSFFDPEQQVVFFGLERFQSFYAITWAPVGLVGLLSPVTLLPGLGLMLMHMTVPWGHGVDRYWGGHVHHLAPLVPFFVTAAILGAARLIRLCRHPRLGRAGLVLPWIVVAGALGYGLWFDLAWARGLNLVVKPWPSWPERWHPAWALLAPLPPEAVPVVPLDASLAASARARSYTFTESLEDKAPGLGLGAGTHLLVHQDNEDILEWGLGMPGAEIVARADPYLLIGWTEGAEDPNAGWWNDPPRKLDSWPYKEGGFVLPPGVAPPAPEEPVLPVKPRPQRD
jgi:uncharacterized membrane protein